MATTSISVDSEEIRRGAVVVPPARLMNILASVCAIAIAVVFAMAAVTADGPRRLSHALLLNGWFALSIGLGALFFIAIQHLVRAGWSVTVRRIAEVMAASIAGPLLLMSPLLLLLFSGSSDLFPWNDAQTVAADKILKGKAAYLNAPFFGIRALIFAAVWIACGRWYLKQSRQQDVDGDQITTLRLEARSAPVLLILGLTTTFAAFDWLMSLDPHWFSTIFGIYAFSGAMVAGLAVISIVTAIMVRSQSTPAVTGEHLHDVVKLLYGMNCFWAYIAFSQYLLIWYANIPEETVWLKHRQEHGWHPVSLALAIGHFAIPFVVLMPRAAKRNTSLVVMMSIGLLAMHWLDLYWIVYPQFAESPVFGLVEIVSLIAFVCIVALFALRALRGGTFLPIRDPRFAESVSHTVE